MSRVLSEIMERALGLGAKEVAADEVAPSLKNVLGVKAVTGVFQPADAWHSALQTKVNDTLAGRASGMFTRRAQDIIDTPKVDVYGAFRGIVDAKEVSDKVRDTLSNSLAPILKGLGDQQLTAYGEMLPHPDNLWGTIGERFGLTTTDLSKVRALKDWDVQLQAETGHSITEGMTKVQQFRAGGGLEGDGLWEREIRNGGLNPDKSNIGRIIDVAMNKGIHDKFLAEPIEAYRAVMDTPGGTSKYLLEPVRGVMKNYADFVEGIPDGSRRVIEGFGDALEANFQKVSPKLAAGLGIDKGGRELLQTAMTMSAAANLALKPSLLVRDVFDWHRPLAVMRTDFLKGMARAMTPEGWAQAAEVEMRGKNISEMMGNMDQSILKGKPTQVADALLAPTRWGNTFGRKATYLGEYDRALQAISDFRSGAIDTQQLINGTALSFHDPAPRSQLLSMAMDRAIPAPMAAHAFGKQAVDSILFSFQYGNQPAALRTGMGRILGQFGQWPMHYIEFVKRLGRMVRDNPSQGLPTLAMWAGANAAMIAAASSVGVDVKNWTYFAPAGYRGGPYGELIANIASAADESPAGLRARHDVLMFPFENFIPGSGAVKSIWRASKERGGLTSDAGMARLLGFRPLDKDQHLELDEWLQKEAGFGTGRQ